MEIAFWFFFGVLCYTFVGYPLLLGILVALKRMISHPLPVVYEWDELPEITLIVACYNEADILPKKIENTKQLRYPINRLKIYFVTDGSSDSSPEIIRQHTGIELFHEPERRGKSAAINRVMPFVKTPVTVYCDANTLLNEDALVLLTRHYKDAKVGAVAGEKKVLKHTEDNAAGTGEGAYWKYESKLKKWDSYLHTVVGAAGELFSIRTELYESVPSGVLIEDFRLSMNIVTKGFRVIYEPDAYAMESGSESIAEENKRKVRISAGGLIEVWHFMFLFNFFKYGIITFQYVSHRMLRWTLAPLSLPGALITNFILALSSDLFFTILLVAQILFYCIGLIGHVFRNHRIRFGILFVPYYFLFMNYSVYQGLVRLIRGQQSSIWDKARRAGELS